jgi:hypothetical protein
LTRFILAMTMAAVLTATTTVSIQL